MYPTITPEPSNEPFTFAFQYLLLIVYKFTQDEDTWSTRAYNNQVWPRENHFNFLRRLSLAAISFSFAKTISSSFFPSE